MDVKKIRIIGAGTMGNGIAQTFAVCGYGVTMTDISGSALQRGLKTVDASLDRLVKKEKLTAEAKAAALGRIKTAADLNAVRGSDLIIEAATENLDLKLKYRPAPLLVEMVEAGYLGRKGRPRILQLREIEAQPACRKGWKTLCLTVVNEE